MELPFIKATVVCVHTLCFSWMTSETLTEKPKILMYYNLWYKRTTIVSRLRELCRQYNVSNSCFLVMLWSPSHTPRAEMLSYIYQLDKLCHGWDLSYAHVSQFVFKSGKYFRNNPKNFLYWSWRTKAKHIIKGITVATIVTQYNFNVIHGFVNKNTNDHIS